jgi:hypothetical protein
MVEKDAPCDSLQSSCDKNHVLKLNINKVTVILRRKSPLWQAAPVLLYYSCIDCVLHSFMSGLRGGFVSSVD